MRLALLAGLAMVGCSGKSGTSGTDPTSTSSTTDTSTTTVPTGTTTTTTLGSAEWTRVDDSAAGAMAGGADIAVAPDGSVLVSWIDNGGSDANIRLTRSTDGGATFSPSVVVDGVEDIVGDWWAGPALHTDGTSVVLVSPARVSSEIRGMVWQGDFATLSFAPGEIYGVGLVEMISAAIAPDGDVWVSWLEYNGGAQVMVANSTVGAAGVNVNSVLGTPSCECCPIELAFSADGRPLLAWRDNDNNVRNIAVASGSPGGQTVANQTVATSTDWVTLSCPVQGPRVAETAGGTHLLSWADSSSGNSTVYVVRSTDFISWDAEIEPAASLGGTQQSPRIAVAPSGTVYLLFTESSAYWVTTSSDEGLTWTNPIQLAVGGNPAERVDLAVGAGQLWIEAEADDKVWVVRVE